MEVNNLIVKDAFKDIKLIPYNTTSSDDSLVIRYIVSSIEKITAFGQFIA